MAHCTTPSGAPGWDTPFEQPPPPSAPARAVAEFVDAVLIPELCTEADPSSGDDGLPSRREIRVAVESFGFDWPSVLKELRRMDLRRPTRYGYLKNDVTPSGIVVDRGKIAMVSKGLASPCPFRRRFVSTQFFNKVVFDNDCGSWTCPKCGAKKAEQLLRQVTERIKGLDEVFWTEVDFDPGLSSRIGQRRRDHDISTFWYRRIDQRVFILADKPIKGRMPPTSCEAVAPDIARLRLIEEMWVPGHERHDWSDSWRPVTADARSKGGLDDLIPITISDKNHDRVMGMFHQEAESRFGVRVDTGNIPDLLRNDLIALYHEMINEVTVIEPATEMLHHADDVSPPKP